MAHPSLHHAAAGHREPFRLLFPLGLTYVTVALALWLIASIDPRWMPPGRAHMGLVVIGFFGCFATGFLMTMLPRLLQTAPIHRAWSLLATLIALVGLGWLLFPGGAAPTGILAAAFGVLLISFAAWHVPHGRQLPPPRMALAGVGLLGGCVAAITTTLPVALPPWLTGTTNAILTQGLMVMLIAAIAGHLLPRFARQQVIAAPGTIGPHAYLRFALMGIILLASYASQQFAIFHGDGFTGYGVRASILVRSILLTILLAPALILHGKQSAWIRVAQLSLWCIVLGSWCAVGWPAYHLAWSHLIFVPGFLLLTLVIAARVVTAHSGRPELLDGDRWWITIMALLIIVGAASRIGAEWSWRTRELHLVLGAIFALLGIAVWLLRFGRLLLPRSQRTLQPERGC